MDRHEGASVKEPRQIVISAADGGLFGPGQAQLSRGLGLGLFEVRIELELVALPPDAAYRIWQPTAVNRLSQAADRDIDSANVQIAAVTPGVPDDVLAAQNGAGIEDEKLEQAELLGPQAE
jgi:hypothetical protein